MSYAENTSVSVERSRAEIEKLLVRAGARKIASSLEPEKATIGFEMCNRFVRFVLPLPNRADPEFETTPSRKWLRSPEDQHKAWEQACRSRWRALCLCIKAKLEAVEAGITSFEHEFLAHIVVPGLGTVGDVVIPKLEESYNSGKPVMLLEC